MLYFAYGSNMDRRQMRSRCPGSALVGPATLRDWRIGFAGYSEGWGGAVATVVPSKGDSVPGLLYRVTERDLAALDACEGHPAVYRRAIVDVALEGSGRVLSPYTYVLLSGDDGVPSARYFRQIESAYLIHGFDVEPLETARDLGKASKVSRVFVYGSLLSGLHNHPVLGGSRLVGEGEISGYTMANLGSFPGVAKGGKGSVVGEVYEVNATTLARLDRLEGHPSFYRRTMVRLVDGSVAWVYLLQPDYVRRSPQVPCGDWRRVVEARGRREFR